MTSERKYICTIQNCTKRPTRYSNYTFYCRNHFKQFVLTHILISKKINKQKLNKTIMWKKIIKN